MPSNKVVPTIRQRSSSKARTSVLHWTALDVELTDVEPSKFHVTIDRQIQHSISWSCCISRTADSATGVRSRLAPPSSVKTLDDEPEQDLPAGRSWRYAIEEATALAEGARQGGVGPRPAARVMARRWRHAAAAAARADLEARRWAATVVAAASGTADGEQQVADALLLEGYNLPAGSCNLYTYPQITTETFPKGTRPSAGGLSLLRQLIIHLLTQTASFDEPDEVRALLTYLLTYPLTY